MAVFVCVLMHQFSERADGVRPLLSLIPALVLFRLHISTDSDTIILSLHDSKLQQCRSAVFMLMIFVFVIAINVSQYVFFNRATCRFSIAFLSFA